MAAKKEKKAQSTFERFMSAPGQKRLFDEEYEELLLSELLLAAMEEDKVSVRKLAKAAGVSPTIVQGLRSGTKSDLKFSTFKAIFDAMGYHVCLEKNGKTIWI